MNSLAAPLPPNERKSIKTIFHLAARSVVGRYTHDSNYDHIGGDDYYWIRKTSKNIWNLKVTKDIKNDMESEQLSLQWL